MTVQVQQLGLKSLRIHAPHIITILAQQQLASNDKSNSTATYLSEFAGARAPMPLTLHCLYHHRDFCAPTGRNRVNSSPPVGVCGRLMRHRLQQGVLATSAHLGLCVSHPWKSFGSRFFTCLKTKLPHLSFARLQNNCIFRGSTAFGLGPG